MEVAPFHFLFDGGVVVFPESGEVAGDLNGAVVGSEDGEHEGHASGGDARGILLGEELLDEDTEAGFLRAGVVDADFFARIDFDAFRGVAVEGGRLGVAEPCAEGRGGVEVLDVAEAAGAVEEFLEDKAVIVFGEGRQFQFRHGGAEEIEAGEPCGDIFRPFGEREAAAEDFFCEDGGGGVRIRFAALAFPDDEVAEADLFALDDAALTGVEERGFLEREVFGEGIAEPVFLQFREELEGDLDFAALDFGDFGGDEEFVSPADGIRRGVAAAAAGEVAAGSARAGAAGYLVAESGEDDSGEGFAVWWGGWGEAAFACDGGEAFREPGGFGGGAAIETDGSAGFRVEAAVGGELPCAQEGLEIAGVLAVLPWAGCSAGKDRAALEQSDGEGDGSHAVVRAGGFHESGVAGVERVAGEDRAECGDFLFRVDGSQFAEELEAAFHAAGVRVFEPAEGIEARDAGCFEGEDDFCEVESEDLGDFGCGAAAVGILAPEAPAGTGGGASGASGALVRAGAGDGLDGEGIDAAVRVPCGEAGEAGIDDCLDAIDREGGFGDVGGDDDAAGAAGADGGVLLGWGEFAVEGKDIEVAGPSFAAEGVDGFADFVGTRHEDEGVALAAGIDGIAADTGRVVPEFAFHRDFFRGVADVDRERAAGGDEVVGGGTEVRPQGIGLEGGRHHEDGEVRTLRFLERERSGQRDVAVEVAFVEFVEDDGGDSFEGGVVDHAAEQDAFGDEADARLAAADIFEADLIADLFAEADIHFFGDPAGEHAGGDSAGLEDDDFAGLGEIVAVEDLGELGGFARAGGGFDDEAAAGWLGLPCGEQGGFDFVDGQQVRHDWVVGEAAEQG